MAGATLIRNPRGDHPRVEAAILALSLALYTAMAIQFRPMIDDAGISFAYARNLAEGHGVVLYPGGERVEGYSDPLWVVILAGAYSLGVPLPLAARVLGFVLGALTLSLTQQLSRGIFGMRGARRYLPSGITLPILALSVPFVEWATSGLENGLYYFLLALAAKLFLDERLNPRAKPYSAVVLLAAAVTRPEGFLYMASLAVLRLGVFPAEAPLARLIAKGRNFWKQPRRFSKAIVSGLRNRRGLSQFLDPMRSVSAAAVKRPSATGPPRTSYPLRRDLLWVLVFLVPFLLYQWWHLQYFTYSLPNTFFAKANPRPLSSLLPSLSLLADDNGWKYVSSFLVQYNLLLCCLGLSMLLKPGGLNGFLTLVAMVVTTAFSAFYVGGDWMPGYRLITPAIPFLVLLLEGGLEGLLDLVRRISPSFKPPGVEGAGLRRLASLAFVSSLLALSFMVVLVPNIGGLRQSTISERAIFTTIEDDGKLAERMAELAGIEGSASYLTPDIGGVAYSSGIHRIVDMGALADVTLAQTKWDKATFREYIFNESRPTFIRTHAGWTSLTALDRFPEFPRDYVAINGSDERGIGAVGLFVRRDVIEMRTIAPEVPVGRIFSQGVELVGYNLSSTTTAPGLSFQLILFWRAPVNIAENLSIEISLGDKLVIDRGIAYGWLPAPRWTPGKFVREFVHIQVGEAPPGEEELRLTVRGPNSSQAMVLTKISIDRIAAYALAVRSSSEMYSEIAAGDFAGALRKAEVARELDPTNSSLAILQREIRIRLATQWSAQALSLYAGGNLDDAVSLALRAWALVSSYGITLPALSDLGQRLAERGGALGARGEYSEAFTMQLRAKMVDPSNPRIRHRLEDARRWTSVREVPVNPRVPIGAVLGGAVELTGVDVESSPVEAGSLMRVVYYWKALRPLAKDYYVFVHLETDANQPVAQDDHQPLLHTGSWPVGLTIKDERYLFVPYELPAANFTLWAGMWDLTNNLAVVGGARFHDDGQRILIHNGSFAGTFHPAGLAESKLNYIRPKDSGTRTDFSSSLVLASVPLYLPAIVILDRGRVRRRFSSLLIPRRPPLIRA